MEVPGNPTSDSPTFQESNDDKPNDALKQVKANKSTVPQSQVLGIVHLTGHVGVESSHRGKQRYVTQWILQKDLLTLKDSSNTDTLLPFN